MSKKIFGYGSLINKTSLQKTAPDVEEIFPCYTKGFIRNFNIKWNRRYCPKFQRYCSVLNLETSNYDNWIGGVYFEVNNKDFEALKQREDAYWIYEINLYDMYGKFVDVWYTFSRRKHKEHNFIENSPIQIEYLEICLQGALSFGQEFYENFCNTTYIKGMLLSRYLKETDISNFLSKDINKYIKELDVWN